MTESGNEQPGVDEQFYNAALTSKDFRQTKEVTLASYDDDNPQAISRETFVPWLVTGFRFSRGDPELQIDYVLWTSCRGGFDGFRTIQSFLDAGGYDCLTQNERDYFDKEFDRIKAHSLSGSQSNELDLQLISWGSDFSVEKCIAEYIDRQTSILSPVISSVHIPHSATRQSFSDNNYSIHTTPGPEDKKSKDFEELRKRWELQRTNIAKSFSGRAKKFLREMDKKEFVRALENARKVKQQL